MRVIGEQRLPLVQTPFIKKGRFEKEEVFDLSARDFLHHYSALIILSQWRQKMRR